MTAASLCLPQGEISKFIYLRYYITFFPIFYYQICQLSHFIFLNPFFGPSWSSLSNWMFELGPNKIFMACSRKHKERMAEHCSVLGVTSFQNNKPVKCMRMNSAVSPIYSTDGQRPSLFKTVRFHRHYWSNSCSNFLQSPCFPSLCALSFPSTVAVGWLVWSCIIPFSGLLKSQHFY